MTSLPTRSAIALVLWAALAPAQTTITLEGVTHRLNPHPRVFFDGPSGAITSSVRDPDGTGPAVAAKANTGNPTWASLINRSNFWKGFGAYNDPAFTIDHTGGQQVALYAMRWYSDNSQTAYRTAALYMLNHIEQYYPTICDETMSNCIWAGGTGYYVTSYGVIYWNQQWLFAYELMRGEMTEQERRDFASKFLNDIAAFGGVTGSPATSCTNPSANAPGTVSVAGGVITSTAPLFGPGNPIQAGDWVAENSTNGSSDPSKVMTIIDETHATVSSRQAGSWNGFSGKLAYRRLQWQDGDCGILWVGKHGPFGPRSVIHVGGSTAYPPGGGSVMDYSSNNTFAMFGQMMAVYLSLADDDANADLRSQAQLTALYHEWYANIWSTYIQHGYTGFHYTGSAYGLSRPFDTAQIPAMMSWSIDGQAPALAGTWVQNFLYHYFMNWIPSCATAELQWGQDFGLINGFSDPNTMYHAAVAYAFTRNTNEGQWFNWALRNRLANCGSYGVNPGTSLFWTPSALSGASINALDQWLYAYTDPTWPSMDLSASGPTAAALNRVDAETGAYPQSALISRTGYNSMTDTLVNFYGFYEKWGDHSWPSGGYYPAAYKIFKGNHLLGADGDEYTNANTPYATRWVSYHAGGSRSGYMEIGGVGNLKPVGTPCGATMPRANTDGSANRFAYAVVDSTPCYKAGVARAQRHLVDFKGGGQQFIVVYDDVATTAGQLKRTYLHYPNNYGASGITDTQRGATAVSGNAIVSGNPGTGHGDATQLLTAILAPGPNKALVYTDKPDGTYTGGAGKTFRVSVCASADGVTCDSGNTAAEFLTIHEPVIGSGNAMDPVTLLEVDTKWRGVQVGGSSSKVALFARDGAAYTNATFTSTHDGVAQILIAGLVPGTYYVAGPTSGGFTVGDDGVLYFEGAAGAYRITLSKNNCVVRGAACVGGKGEVR